VHTPAEPTPLTQTPTMNPFLRHNCASHQQTVDRFCFQTFSEGSLTPASSHGLPDLLIRSAVLCRSCLLSHLTFPGTADCSPFPSKCARSKCLTLRVHSTGPQLRGWSKDESRKCFAIRGKIGGREGIRTPDPLLAKQVLSQLSYTPTVGVAFILKHFPRFQNPFPRIFITLSGP
jgi:hypothetical protein